MSYGVFDEASRDYEAELLASRRELARVAIKENIFPFLALASTDQEYADRKALAGDSIHRIAVQAELPPSEVERLTDSMFDRIKEGRTVAMTRTAAMACANCGHTSVDHSEALTCPTCGCNDFTPMSKNARRATAGEGGGPF